MFSLKLELNNSWKGFLKNRFKVIITSRNEYIYRK